MLHFLADENFNNNILRGLLRRSPKLDIVGQPMPGVLESNRHVPIGTAIEDILILAEYSDDDEWQGQVRYLPLR